MIEVFLERVLTHLAEIDIDAAVENARQTGAELGRNVGIDPS